MPEVPEFDKGVPITPQGPKWGWMRLMEVDDSKFLPGEDIASVASAYSRYSPMKFTSRTVTEDDIPGVRVWRTE